MIGPIKESFSITIRGGTSFNDDCSDLHHQAQNAAIKILGQSYSFQANQAGIFFLRILFLKCSSCSSLSVNTKQTEILISDIKVQDIKCRNKS